MNKTTKSSPLVLFSAGFIAGSVLFGSVAAIAATAYVQMRDNMIGVKSKASIAVYCVDANSEVTPTNVSVSTFSQRLLPRTVYAGGANISCP